MELIKINSNNRPYYSDDFIKGFECGAKRQFEADKKARPKGEWASVLAELHERFDVLEKEIRKASAEMSAVIREYVDRPQGEWMPYEAYLDKDREHSVTEHKCSLCGYLWGEPEYRYCPNCGADMRGERADEHGRNKSADRQ